MNLKRFLLILILSFFSTISLAKGLIIEMKSSEYNPKDKSNIYYSPRAIIDDTEITGSVMYYYPDKKYFRMTGNLSFQNSRVLLTGDSLEYNLETKKAVFHKASLFDKRTNTYVKARKIERESPTRFILYDSIATYCNPENPGWEVKSSYLVYNLEDIAYAQNVIMNIHTVPVLYVPVIAWTTKQKRGSGLLPPRYSSRNSSDKATRYGQRIEIPWFFDIAQDQDLTLTADMLQYRGLGYDLEYNYAFKPGMLGKLKFWNLQEAVEDRDLEYENLGGLSKAPDDLKPNRYRLLLEHKQKIFFDGDLYYNYQLNSDNEVNKEYFNSTVDLDYHYKHQFSTVFQIPNGSLRIEATKEAKFKYKSVFDKEDDAETTANKLPKVTVSQNFSNIGGTALSASGTASITNYQRKYGWEGQQNEAEIESSYPFAIDFLNFIPKVTSKYFAENLKYNLNKNSGEHLDSSGNVLNSSGDTVITDLDKYEGNFSWNVNTYELEANFELYRLFYNSQNRATKRFSIKPRLIFEQVADVNQDKVRFSSKEYGRKTITQRLDFSLLSKDLKTNTVNEPFSLNLIQKYNLWRDRNFSGPVIAENLQQTEKGNYQMPLKIELKLKPNKRYYGSLDYRYDHKDSRMIETNIGLGVNTVTGNNLGITYKRNTKAYRTLDNIEHPKTRSYDISNSFNVSSKLNLYFKGTWDYERKLTRDPSDSIKRLKRTMTDFTAGVIFNHGCYSIKGEYAEQIKTGTYSGNQREYLDRRVMLTFSISDFTHEQGYEIP